MNVKKPPRPTSLKPTMKNPPEPSRNPLNGSSANSDKSKMFSAVLCSVFFISGASALMFETLWFRLAGLTFGNSVWASSLVLASFMAGMALGNWLATTQGNRIRFPVRFYALLEVVAGTSGLALVILFPFLTHWLKPWFRAVLDTPFVLNFLRLSISFVLMTIPAMCMGMTLPLLVKALYSESPNFGEVLGKLYGWNTMGAVAGTLVTEAVFIGWLGVRGTGIAAALLNFLAAGTAIIIAWLPLKEGRESIKQSSISVKLSKLSATGKLMLLAGFFSGAILLALEVVWFRFLILFVNARSLAFSVMLSVVLAGIGIGGILASLWFRKQNRPQQNAAAIALLSGALSVLTYVVFGWLVTPFTLYHSEWTHMFYISIILMFPVSLLSGILFTFIGEGVYLDVGESLETTGLLTMVNTVGAALGALLAGFVLLPKLGMEKSFFLLSFSYVLVAIFVSDRTQQVQSKMKNYATIAVAAVFLISIALFPFGSMKERILSIGEANLVGQDRRWVPVAIREGLTETSQFWQRRVANKPVYTWLFTNNHAMSTTGINGRRYMKLFVYLPAAIHPNLKNALLICYGVGCTAQALTETPGIKSIDVIDISSDILDSSQIVYPDQKDNPLKDPRVRSRVEDGRFFLQTTENHYDLITGEPPPPLMAGVVNLYSEEYFQLIYDRLNEGGIATYWLPVNQLTDSGAKSIIKAFCNVFQDCSLWTGHGYNFMLVGTRNAKGPVLESDFIQQWSKPAARELTRLGFEKPEQIGSTFLMDAAALKEFTGESLPVTDNYPKRIFGLPGDVQATSLEQYRSLLLDTKRSKELFRASPLVSALWPESLRAQTLEYFPFQGLLNDSIIRQGQDMREVITQTLHPILVRSSLRFPVLLVMQGNEPVYPEDFGWNPDDQALREVPGFNYVLGVTAMADRHFLEAEKYFAAEQRISRLANLVDYRVYLLCMGGKTEDAQKLAQANLERYEKGSGQLYLAWLFQNFGLALPQAGQK
jgi:spermidine synthase